MRWTWLLVMAAAGCGAQATGGDAGHLVPDGFLQTMCMDPSDCDDGNPCTLDDCSHTQGCLHQQKNCTGSGDACTNGLCDPATGNCFAMPANEAMPCTLSTGMPGTCMLGVCTMLPTCQKSPTTTLDCSVPTRTITGNTLGPNVISSYSCPNATNLTGAELAYPFYNYQDRTVTVSLTNALVDLDLMVLDGNNCVSTAMCEGSSLATGTANEKVTFTARANQNYLVVVDGKNGASGSFTLTTDCATCVPLQTLGCNMTSSGDSSGTQATRALASYQCQAGEVGPEDTYQLKPTVTTNYKIKLSALTTDLDLFVIDDYNGCNSSYCDASSVTAGTANEMLSFKGYSGSVYDVVVDTKLANGGPYALEVDCPPSCLGSATVDCNSRGDSRRNDDATLSKNVVDSWGACDTNTTGPEVVYQFNPPTAGMYTFTLTGLTADLDLIVTAGDYYTCDPTTVCVASGVTAGTADETVSFMGDPSKYYYIAVDGKNGATSPYTLKLKSTQCPGASCYNGLDTLSCSYLEDSRRNDDATRSKNIVDAWACDANTTGPEVVYAFTPAVAGMYTVTLDGLAANLDLTVVSNVSQFTCDSNAACVGSSVNTGTANESVTFAADTSHTYYLGVDGVAGAVSPYHIKLAGASCPAPICTDGSSSLSCTSLSVSNRNDAPYYSTSDVSAWGTCDTNTTGPEYAHLFYPSGPGPYTIEMIGLHADLDLIVQETSSTAPMCSVGAPCYASSTNTGTADEKVTFTANAGKDYYLIVDGKNGATSSYTLAITNGCP